LVGQGTAEEVRRGVAGYGGVRFGKVRLIW